MLLRTISRDLGMTSIHESQHMTHERVGQQTFHGDGLLDVICCLCTGVIVFLGMISDAGGALW